MNPIKNPFRVNAALVLTLCSPSVFSSDADDVRSTIERHYAFINTQDYEAASNHHLPDFTMFFLTEDRFGRLTTQQSATE